MTNLVIIYVHFCYIYIKLMSSTRLNTKYFNWPNRFMILTQAHICPWCHTLDITVSGRIVRLEIKPNGRWDDPTSHSWSVHNQTLKVCCPRIQTSSDSFFFSSIVCQRPKLDSEADRHTPPLRFLVSLR